MYICVCSVRVIEGTVDKLMEEGDTVTGVRYQQKGSDESEVGSHGSIMLVP